MVTDSKIPQKKTAPERADKSYLWKEQRKKTTEKKPLSLSVTLVALWTVFYEKKMKKHSNFD